MADIDALRQRVREWKPGMTIEIRVDELTSLLDEIELLRRMRDLRLRLREFGRRLAG